MNVEPVRRALEAVGAPYALIGGHALAARGYPRFTVDIDLLTTDSRVLESATWSTLEADGAAIERRRGDDDDPLAGVVHVVLPDGTDIDVVVGRWPWEAALIARAEPLTVAEGVRIPVPSAADLILLKLAAGGFLDLQDAAALLAVVEDAGVIREVESRIGEVRPDVRKVWRELLDKVRSSGR